MLRISDHQFTSRSWNKKFIKKLDTHTVHFYHQLNWSYSCETTLFLWEIVVKEEKSRLSKLSHCCTRNYFVLSSYSACICRIRIDNFEPSIRGELSSHIFEEFLIFNTCKAVSQKRVENYSQYMFSLSAFLSITFFRICRTMQRVIWTLHFGIKGGPDETIEMYQKTYYCNPGEIYMLLGITKADYLDQIKYIRKSEKIGKMNALFILNSTIVKGRKLSLFKYFCRR